MTTLCLPSSVALEDSAMGEALSREELEAADCWEADDRVPGRPQMTAFRRRVRYHQARWREAKGHPIGSQPIVPRPGKPVRPVGSRLPLDYARETGGNFLNANALAAVRARTAVTEAHQSFDHQRLWADLLWSPALGFNLAGDLAADLELADRVIHRWWPDAPGRRCPPGGNGRRPPRPVPAELIPAPTGPPPPPRPAPSLPRGAGRARSGSPRPGSAGRRPR